MTDHRQVASQQAPRNEPAPKRIRRSIAVLILMNLVPIAGVLFLDWDIAALVVLYWSENLIIGFYNIVRMLVVAGPRAVLPSLFFSIHYGGFCAVHGFFIMSLLLDQQPSMSGDSWPFFLVFLQLLVNVVQALLHTVPQAWLVGFVGLTISHGYSFFANFIGTEERQNMSVKKLMTAPYARIFIMHLTVIAGGFAITAMGQPLALLVTLVIVKTIADIYLHRREHSVS